MFDVVVKAYSYKTKSHKNPSTHLLSISQLEYYATKKAAAIIFMQKK